MLFGKFKVLCCTYQHILDSFDYFDIFLVCRGFVAARMSDEIVHIHIIMLMSVKLQNANNEIAVDCSSEQLP